MWMQNVNINSDSEEKTKMQKQFILDVDCEFQFTFLSWEKFICLNNFVISHSFLVVVIFFSGSGELKTYNASQDFGWMKLYLHEQLRIL